MKKCLLITLFFLFGSLVIAQNAEALVKAEKAFEKSCFDKGIRDGFPAHVDS
jgi:hypothetical protein